MDPDDPEAQAYRLCKDFCENIRRKERPGLLCDGAEACYVSRDDQFKYWTNDKISELLRVSAIIADSKTIRQNYVRVLSTLAAMQATSHLPALQYLDDLILHQRNDASLPWSDTFRGFENESHFQLFRKLQWRFCPVSIDREQPMLNRLLDRCEILPLSRLDSNSQPKFRVKPTPSRSSTLTAFEVNYDGEPSSEPQRQGHSQAIRYVVFKTFRNHLIFNDEREAYHAFKRHKNIVDYYGSFHWYSESHDRHSTIILELAEGGSLLDLYNRNEPPTTAEGIYRFWMHFIGLVEGVMALHNHEYEPGYAVIHQDLKPSNVLVFPNQTRSPPSLELKIGDLGASTVKYGSQHQRNSGPDTGSGKTYGPPELHLGGRMSIKVGLHVDIWALACILLEAAVWVAFGEAERLAFRDRRISETSKLSDEHRRIGCSDTFHDGLEPLRCVQDVHTKVRSNYREYDTLTPEIVDYILMDCLVDYGIRPTASQVRAKLGKILQYRLITPLQYYNQSISWQTTTPTNSITDEGMLGHVINQGTQMQQRPAPQTEPLFSNSWDSHAQQKTTLSAGPILPPPRAILTSPLPLQQRDGISPRLSASPTHSRYTPTRSDAGFLRHHISYPTPSHPEVTSSDLHRWISQHKKDVAVDLPGWNAIQDTLAGRDFIIIVDNSRFMLGHREELYSLVKDLSYLMKNMDHDGVEVVFTSSPAVKHKCKSSTAVAALLKSVFGPRSSSYCNMELTLNEVLKDVKRNFEMSAKVNQSRRIFTTRKPSAVSIYVFTNGIWDNSEQGFCGVDTSIENLITFMKMNDVARTQAAIQFVRFGSNEIGENRLNYLDNDLPKKAQNKDYDIVNHNASTDNIWEILKSSLYPAEPVYSNFDQENPVENDLTKEPGYSSFDQDISMDNDLTEDDDTDIESIKSVVFDDDISAYSSNSSQPDRGYMLVVEELAGFLQQDVELEPLFRAAITAVGLDRFKRNIVKLLTNYGRNLRKEACPGSQYDVSSFVWRHRRETARIIGDQMNADKHLPVEMMDSSTREADLNQWINAKSNHRHDPGNFASSTHADFEKTRRHEDFHNGDSDESDSDDSQRPEGLSDPPINLLQEAKDFLESAEAMQILRTEFRQWLGITKESPEIEDQQEIEVQQKAHKVPDNGASDKDIECIESSGERSSRVDGLSGVTVVHSVQTRNAGTQQRIQTKDAATQKRVAMRDAATQFPEMDHHLNKERIRTSASQTHETTVIRKSYEEEFQLVSQDQTISEIFDGVLSLFRYFLPEPQLAPGMSRIRWTCTCGQSLFDDFIELEPGALDKLQQHLNGQDDIQNEVPHDLHVVQDIQDSIRNGGRRVQVVLRSVVDSINHGIKILVQTGKRLNTELRIPAATSGQSPLPSTQTTPHLLMCIDRGDTWTGLHQECVRSVTDDRQLFEFLRCQYFKSRTSVSRLTLRSVKKISLSRFAADVNEFASVHGHHDVCHDAICVCIPPVERVDAGEYICTPAPTSPPKYLPVIGPNDLTHYFRRPHDARKGQKRILKQLPKKAGGPLSATLDDTELGWGVHFEEGWHLATIILLMVCPLGLGSLIFGIVWSVAKGDIQGGFAIASTALAVVPILLGIIGLGNRAR